MRKNRSKISLLFTALVFSIISSSCGDLQGYIASDALKGVQEVTISSSKLNLTIDTTVNCSFDAYFADNFDRTQENEDLKKWCFTSLMDAHDIAMTDFKKSPNTSTSGTKEQSLYFLSKIGFDVIDKVTIGANATEDVNDTIRMVYSKKYIGTSKTTKKALYFYNVSLCGSDGTDEWKSDFDIGCDSAVYGGTHADWLNKENHKGFDVAANRVYNYLKKEIGTSYNSTFDAFVAISGYSRGAAVANIVASKIIDNPQGIRRNGVKLASYNFACPATTTSTSCKDSKYDVIHNYVNEEDVITHIPPTTPTMNFQRYGKDHSFTVQDKQTIKDRTNAITHRVYNASCAGNVINAINNIATTREGLYAPIEDESHKTYKIDNEDNITEEMALAEGQAFIEEMNRRGLKNCFKSAGVTMAYKFGYYDDPEEGLTPIDIPYYIWHCYVGDGVILQVLLTAMSAMLSNNTEDATRNNYLINYTNQGNNFGVISNALVSYPDYVNDAHNPPVYFCSCFES